LSNGFTRVPPREPLRDEDGLLDPARFSLLYTGTAGARGKDLTPFLEALAEMVQRRPELGSRVEVVFAGGFTRAEMRAMRSEPLDTMVRIIGRVAHDRARYLQQSADGLLLVTTGHRNVATAKLYEYLGARKPIFALVGDDDAAKLLRQAGGHTLAPLVGKEAVLTALTSYLMRHAEREEPFTPDPSFKLESYEYTSIAARLLELFAS
jgi:hypothetical protein